MSNKQLIIAITSQLLVKKMTIVISAISDYNLAFCFPFFLSVGWHTHTHTHTHTDVWPWFSWFIPSLITIRLVSFLIEMFHPKTFPDCWQMTNACPVNCFFFSIFFFIFSFFFLCRKENFLGGHNGRDWLIVVTV